MVTERFTLRAARIVRSSNPIWTGLETVFGIALLSAIFALVFPAPPLGDSFVLFYASGFLPLGVFVAFTAKLAPRVRQARNRSGQDPLEAAATHLLAATLTQIAIAAGLLFAISFWVGAIAPGIALLLTGPTKCA